MDEERDPWKQFKIVGKWDAGMMVALDEPEYVANYQPGDVIYRDGKFYRVVEHPHYGQDLLPVEV